MESYLVIVTDVSGTDTSLSGTYNTSQCLPITSDLFPDVCGPFMASVVAVNGVGTSNKTVYIENNMTNANVDSLACLESRGLCKLWYNKLNSNQVEVTHLVLSTIQGIRTTHQGIRLYACIVQLA